MEVCVNSTDFREFHAPLGAREVSDKSVYGGGLINQVPVGVEVFKDLSAVVPHKKIV